MVSYTFSERAYAKMLFHAAKYPHFTINGVLLSEKTTKGAVVSIVDAIPLFHQCLYVTPMAEIAMTQIDAYAERNNLIITGYYAASELISESSVEKIPAAKLAEKIQELNSHACVAVIDNTLLGQQEEPAIKVFADSYDSGRWSKVPFAIENKRSTLEAVSMLIKRGAMRDISDFDNFLDNPENDWTNQFVNNDLQKILTMY